MKLTTEELKKWIDGASYDMLSLKWRHDDHRGPYFEGEIKEHFIATMKKRREEMIARAHPALQKELDESLN